MPTYDFETITAAQALAWQPSDLLHVAIGSATTTTVIYNADGTYTLTIGSRTLTFSSSFSPYPGHVGVAYPDSSSLWIGHAASENFNLTVRGEFQNGAAYGGDGNDSISSNGSGSWLVQGNQGNDRILLSEGSQTVYGGQGDDYILVGGLVMAGRHSFMQGNKGNDTIVGDGNANTILGGQGDDNLSGSSGHDTLNGNLGNDTISGSGLIAGEGGDDKIDSGPGSTIYGGDGSDVITVTGDSTASAGVFVSGDGGDDRIVSGAGADTLLGGDGADTISSGGNDVIDGGAGSDLLTASPGNNSVQGGADNDTISSGEGADTIDGGAGADILTGGSGADLFIVVDPYVIPQPNGFDRITDWSSSDHIRFRFTVGQSYAETTASDFTASMTAAQNTMAASNVHVVAVQVGSDVVVFADDGASHIVDTGVVLVGRTLADVAPSSFV